jgi:hypothetical protein
MRWLYTLNKYGTLIGAVATIIYVMLTYRMLKVLRRESMRDQRLQHLADIKNKVITPIKQWLDNVVVPGLRGGAPIVSTSVVQRPRTHVVLGEPSTESVRQLVCNLPVHDAINSLLFLHAKQEHFPDEFEFVQACTSKLETLRSRLLQFANACADKVASGTSLGRTRAAVAGPAEFADSDFLTALYVTHLLAGNTPDLQVMVPAPGAVEIRTLLGELVGRGGTDAVKSWHESAQRLLLERWRESNLGKLAVETVAQVLIASTKLNELQLSYELKGDCRYLGGPGPNRIKATLRPLRRWLKRA